MTLSITLTSKPWLDTVKIEPFENYRYVHPKRGDSGDVVLIENINVIIDKENQTGYTLPIGMLGTLVPQMNDKYCPTNLELVVVQTSIGRFYLISLEKLAVMVTGLLLTPV